MNKSTGPRARLLGINHGPFTYSSVALGKVKALCLSVLICKLGIIVSLRWVIMKIKLVNKYTVLRNGLGIMCYITASHHGDAAAGDRDGN